MTAVVKVGDWEMVVPASVVENPKALAEIKEILRKINDAGTSN